MIFLLYTAYLIGLTMCHDALKENGAHPNVTILYPVNNTFFFSKDEYNKFKTNENVTNDPILYKREKSNTKYNKIENNEEVGKDTLKELNKTISDDVRHSEDDIIGTRDKIIKNTTNSSNCENDNIHLKEPTIYQTNWETDTEPTPPAFGNENILYMSKNKSLNNTLQAKGKEFKASPELGNFYDEDTFVIPTQDTIGSSIQFAKNPPFTSSPRDFYKLNYKPPGFTYREQNGEPYKFENTLLSGTKDWNYSYGIEPTPTVETPVKIPAGGLYKYPEAFKEKPGFDGEDETLGLEFKDEGKDSKENSLNKRGNPWKSFLNLIAALVPVGIIISALTPSIITLESAGNNPHFPSRFSGRSDNVSELPPISESCKRRLLCEIHSDANYVRISSFPRRQKHCYKLQCDDPQALNKILHWLLLYHRSRDYRPHDRRGYIT